MVLLLNYTPTLTDTAEDALVCCALSSTSLADDTVDTGDTGATGEEVTGDELPTLEDIEVQGTDAAGKILPPDGIRLSPFPDISGDC